MIYNLTIGKKIGLGFGFLILLTIIIFVYTTFTMFKSKEINDKINNVYIPSVDALEKFNLLVTQSKMYVSNWVFIQSSEENMDKQKMKRLLNQEYPLLKDRILALSSNWDKNEQENIKEVFTQVDSLFDYNRTVMSSLNSFSSYEDAMIMFTVRPMIEGGEIEQTSNRILDNLENVSIKMQNNSRKVSKEMVDSFNVLQTVIINSGIILLIGGVIVSFLTIRSIVKPVTELKEILLLLGKGIQPDSKIKPGSDEIGEMTVAMNTMIDGLKRTTIFSKEVGSGNFSADYMPLSNQDVLGNSLIKMKNELKDLTSNLEKKVEERTEEVVKAKKVIEHLFEEQTDSIKYAERIQLSILPPQKLIKDKFPDSFVLYKPKDIISGDFYWFAEQSDNIFFAAVDCTGHGVPGALMTVVGSSLLTQAMSSKVNITPSELLDELNKGVSTTLRQGENEKASKDGMDISVCCFNFQKNTLVWAGAFNPLYIIRNGELIETKADKFPIGYYTTDPNMKYNNREFDLLKGDLVYMFTDGYCDQFGGPLGKKFMYKRFRELLLSITSEPMETQREILANTIESWILEANDEQLDDIEVIGIRV